MLREQIASLSLSGNGQEELHESLHEGQQSDGQCILLTGAIMERANSDLPEYTGQQVPLGNLIHKEPAPEYGHDEEDEGVRYEEEHYEFDGRIENAGGHNTERGSTGIELRSALGKGDDTGGPAYPGIPLRDHSSQVANQMDVATASSDAEDDVLENTVELLDRQKIGMNNTCKQITPGSDESHQGAAVGKVLEDDNADRGDEESATPQPIIGTERCESHGTYPIAHFT